MAARLTFAERLNMVFGSCASPGGLGVCKWKWLGTRGEKYHLEKEALFVKQAFSF